MPNPTNPPPIQLVTPPPTPVPSTQSSPSSIGDSLDLSSNLFLDLSDTSFLSLSSRSSLDLSSAETLASLEPEEEYEVASLVLEEYEVASLVLEFPDRPPTGKSPKTACADTGGSPKIPSAHPRPTEGSPEPASQPRPRSTFFTNPKFLAFQGSQKLAPTESPDPLHPFPLAPTRLTSCGDNNCPAPPSAELQRHYEASGQRDGAYISLLRSSTIHEFSTETALYASRGVTRTDTSTFYSSSCSSSSFSSFSSSYTGMRRNDDGPITAEDCIPLWSSIQELRSDLQKEAERQEVKERKQSHRNFSLFMPPPSLHCRSNSSGSEISFYENMGLSNRSSYTTNGRGLFTLTNHRFSTLSPFSTPRRPRERYDLDGNPVEAPTLVWDEILGEKWRARTPTPSVISRPEVGLLTRHRHQGLEALSRHQGEGMELPSRYHHDSLEMTSRYQHEDMEFRKEVDTPITTTASNMPLQPFTEMSVVVVADSQDVFQSASSENLRSPPRRLFRTRTVRTVESKSSGTGGRASWGTGSSGTGEEKKKKGLLERAKTRAVKWGGGVVGLKGKV